MVYYGKLLQLWQFDPVQPEHKMVLINSGNKKSRVCSKFSKRFLSVFKFLWYNNFDTKMIIWTSGIPCR